MQHLPRSLYHKLKPAFTLHPALIARMSSNVSISEQLSTHIKENLTSALSEWPGADSSHCAEVAAAVVCHIEAFSRGDESVPVTVKELNKKCFNNAYFVTRYLKHNPGNISSFETSVDGVKKILEFELQRNVSNGKIFEDITSHHWDIQKRSWDDTVADANELATYAQAATQMGEKKWVKIANDWIRSSCYRFFCHGGAKKAMIKWMKKVNGGAATKASLDSLTLCNNLMESKDPTLGVAFNEKIRMLDIGACYNPLLAPADASAAFSIDVGVPQDAMDVLGVDLYPANPSVLQCDFLNVVVADPESGVETAEAIDIIDGDDYKRVVSLPAQSFDAACMCLVLSYLPDPMQRLKMIQNAWALLKTPSARDGPEPHKTGLLVIVEKVSVFGNNPDSRKYINEWRDEIENVGFDMVSAQCLATTGSHAYGLIFRKHDRNGMANAGPGDGLHTRRERINSQRARSNEGLASSKNNDPEGERALKRTKITHATKPTSSSAVTASSSLYADRRPLRVAIIGGGIGGFALALALQKIKHIKFKVYEKDSNFDCRKQGYALTMQQGLSALRILGIDREILQSGITSTEHVSYDRDGTLLGVYGPNSAVRESAAFKQVEMKVSGSDSDNSASSSSDLKPNSSGKTAKRRRHNVHISRQSLRDMMMQKVDPTLIAWGHKLADCVAESDSNEIKLKFEHGVEEVADLVVAADGINSAVRQLLFPRQKLNYLGLLVVLGISKHSDVGEDRTYRKVQWVDGSTRVFSMPFDEDRVMWQLSFPISDEIAALVASATPESLHAAALIQCDGWHAPLLNLIRETDLSMISGHPVYDLDPAAVDRNGTANKISSKVTFLGDSVHPMSPFKGQGANQALADAISLAGSLSSIYSRCANQTASSAEVSINEIINDALLKYEAEMLERSTSKVLKSRSAAEYLHSDAALTSGNITRAAAAAAAAVPSTRK